MLSGYLSRGTESEGLRRVCHIARAGQCATGADDTAQPRRRREERMILKFKSQSRMRAAAAGAAPAAALHTCARRRAARGEAMAHRSSLDDMRPSVLSVKVAARNVLLPQRKAP